METTLSTSLAPRAATAGELQELADWLIGSGHDRETALGFAQSAFAALYDDYITDCPGYAGKLMSVIWGGGPSFFDVFIWQDGQLIRSGREYDEKECDRCGENGGTLCFNCWNQSKR